MRATFSLPFKYVALSILSLSLVGCGTFKSSSPSNRPEYRPGQPDHQTPQTKEALRWVGRPYRFGGSNPASGFDCSGLVYYSNLVTQGGVPPRTVKDQYAASYAISINEIRPGDWLFYAVNNKGPDHVGVFIGNHSFVHAPHTGGVVGVVDMNTTYWRQRFLGARRY